MYPTHLQPFKTGETDCVRVSLKKGYDLVLIKKFALACPLKAMGGGPVTISAPPLLTSAPPPVAATAAPDKPKAYYENAPGKVSDFAESD